MPSTKQTDKAVTADDYWTGKTPCWEMTHCPQSIHTDCPAFRHRQHPCWEIEGTYCKWNGWGTLGRDTSLCLICQVFLTYGKGERIKLTLRGQGIELLNKAR